MHVLLIHEGKYQRVHCKKCDKSFSNESNLYRHQKLHEMKEKGLKFHCKECKVSYTCKSNFTRHVNKEHTNNRLEPVIVLDETEFLKNQEETIDMPDKDHPLPTRTYKEKSKEQKLSESKEKSKPKKGMWIVKLVKLKTFPQNSQSNQK